jgi:hypothetical protein
MFKALLAAIALAGLVIAVGAASASPCSTEIESLQKQLSSSDAGMGPTGTGTGTGTVQETGNLHPPTAAMNQATDGSAASSQDVAKQNQGEPTASQSAQTGASDAASSPMAAEDSLKQARQFDQAGNQTACMNAVKAAKKQLGIE